MSTADTRQLVAKLWNYCDVLRDDGVSTIDYVEQLTYLLFLKMAHERANRPLNPDTALKGVADRWQQLLDFDGDDLEKAYRHTLEDLGQQAGTLGVIFRKAQNKIQDPAKLKKLIADLIDKETWSAQGVDVKGDAYEELLAKSAEDIKTGAGQYFTPQGSDLRHGRLHPAGTRRHDRRPRLRHRRVPARRLRIHPAPLRHRADA